jgi:N-acetylglucosaminyldiphosphoundecaprenol N-acetyl-beta-D-mannosaminyltransferase
MRKNEFETIEILRSKVNIVELSDVVNGMKRWIEEPDGQCHRITVTGFHGLWEGFRDAYLRDILNSADLWIADGIAPILIARARGIRNMRRIPGAELMEVFFQLANQERYGSFFYGDTNETLAQLRNSIEQQYPGHRICGMYSPPFRPLTLEEDRRVVEMINKAKPDVVWVGLGMPKQDRWVFEHKDRLHAPVAVGVGAAFGFHAGTIKRVPKVIGEIGLEWLWRFAMEPKKLWRRDLIDGPRFLYHVGLELVGLERYGQSADRDLTSAGQVDI